MTASSWPCRPYIAAELSVPACAKSKCEFRAIVNAHFRIDPPPSLAPIVGVVNGTVEWLFCFKHRVSVTISAADRLLDIPRETLARKIWEEVAIVAGKSQCHAAVANRARAPGDLCGDAGPDAGRPGSATAWSNLFLAGDWTDTGLPATIEGAVRSGNHSADLAGRS